MDHALASTIRAANTALIARGNEEAIGEFFTKGYVAHLTDHDMKGHDWIRRFVRMLRRAFPDLQVKVQIFVEGENRVAWQRTLRGTHEGEFMGFPATGRRVAWRDMFASRFRNGLIAEEWVISDLAERLLIARKR